MQNKKTVLQLDPEVEALLDETCARLDLTKSLFVNVVLKELFQKASPDDWFFNRIHLCRGETMLDEEELVPIMPNNRRQTHI